MFRSVIWTAVLVALIVSCPRAQGQTAPTAKPVPSRYDNHKLIRVHPNTQPEVDALIAAGARILNCITGVGRQPMECVVSPEAFTRLKVMLIKFEVLNENIGPLIEAQVARMQNSPPPQDEGGIAGGAGWFVDYKTYPQVNAYIDTLVALRPDLISKIALGTTVEGRTTYAMRISGPGAPGTKPAVIFSGCQHAREWIAVMVPMYIAEALVRRYNTDPAIKSIVDRVEFFIIPIVNPDGYKYTYAPGGDRFWRKNRRNNGGGVYGVDLNRNWSVAWNGGESNSSDPNSDL